MLGLVSLATDVASELVHSLLPVFLVTTLGTSVAAVGWIEGAAEATALIVKVFSGTLSDYFGKRKPFAVLGYALGAATKPLFAVAHGVGLVLTARLIDRVGKGIRGAPRDALIADLTTPEIRGAAYGLRQALDTVGAVLGPLLAMGLMFAFANDFRAVFWFAVLPGALSVLLLVFGVREPEGKPSKAKRASPLSRASLARLPSEYWRVVGIGGLFTLARFSEAFLLLRAQEGGLGPALVPLVLVGMNVVYALSAYPFGKLSDKVDRRRLLAFGLVPLVLADVVLANGSSWPWIACGAGFWGLHMGMTQGLLATLVSGTAPAELRGTAFGFFNLLSGLALLLASALAGMLWDSYGAEFTFWTGAGLATLAILASSLTGRASRA